MEPTNDEPNEDGFQVVGPPAEPDALGSRPPQEPSPIGGGDPMFAGLLDYLQTQLGGAPKRDEKRHDAQMGKVGQHLRAAMAEADAEQNASESAEAETLAWGLWRSECGCLHISVPDGRGGWAVAMEEVEPEKLVEVVQAAARDLGATAATLLRSLYEAP